MDRISIGFDIDGVALRYTEEFNRVFKLFGGKSDLSRVSSFNFFANRYVLSVIPLLLLLTIGVISLLMQNRGIQMW